MITSWFQKNFSISRAHLWQDEVITWEIITGIYVETAMNFWSKTWQIKETQAFICVGYVHACVRSKQELYKGDLAKSLILRNQGALRTPCARQKLAALEILPVRNSPQMEQVSGLRRLATNDQNWFASQVRSGRLGAEQDSVQLEPTNRKGVSHQSSRNTCIMEARPKQGRQHKAGANN